MVHASMISGGMPLGGGMSITTMTRPGTEDRTGDDGISIRRVTPDYHKALRIPLRHGRYFEATDRKGAPNVVIINESAAKKYFPGENPIGRTVKLNDRIGTVVGVVGDVHQTSLETEPRTEVYVPIAQAQRRLRRARGPHERRSVRACCRRSRPPCSPSCPTCRSATSGRWRS